MDTVSEVKIENLSNWLKSLRLKSVTVVHIPPRATSQAIAGVKVQDNAEVEKLLPKSCGGNAPPIPEGLGGDVPCRSLPHLFYPEVFVIKSSYVSQRS